MAIKLLRESSETPNISNKDDVKMARYAYGGYDGIVQKYGEQLAHSVSGSSLHIGSGRVVVDGWEVDIDGAGVDLNFSHMSSGVYYYTVYLEVNAELETVEVKTLYDTAEYPTVDEGDDLTEAQSGTARLTLYTFLISYGAISNVARKVVYIPYDKTKHDAADATLSSHATTLESHTRTLSSHASSISAHSSSISSIESRLSRLGFRQGSCSVSGASSIQVNSLKRQGNYVIMDVVFYASGSSFSINIPSGFKPKSGVPVIVPYNGSLKGFMEVTISTSGSFGINLGSYSIGNVLLRNIGWETSDT